ncbi:hypothetical protein [Photobacterium damselae]|uniref:hypothetical protein n=1 Tax=Photobacterium damselae TaxID=38293 RepID=UPI001EFE3EC5|nr:hypothetical protein [Photobacterium damselae]MCG9780706.1 hypothetical protein [Photobacterium damselae]
MIYKSVVLLSVLPLSMLAHAASPDAPDISKAALSWTGAVNIIPGNAYTITGKDGSMKLEDGHLTLHTDGTFISSPVVLEGHKYSKDTSGKMLVGDFASAAWSLEPKSISMDWGSNSEAAANISSNIKLIDKSTMTDLGTGSVSASVVDLMVQNNVPTTALVNNLSELATIRATIVASFDTAG